jgi:S-adenosylmethionine synthetase
MVNINIEPIRTTNVEDDSVEIVERKGFGHPDTIINSLVDSISVEYFKHWKQHHNFDKATLFAGVTEPAFGGGKIIKPPTICLGDRATTNIDGKKVDIHPVIERTIINWFENNIPTFPIPKYVSYLAEGSGNLTDIFERNKKGEYLPANDTSAATGYAPFTPTENVTLGLEKYLNSPELKKQFPCSGKDIKIMTVRNGRNFDITIAMAMIDKYIPDIGAYKRYKNDITRLSTYYCKEQYPDYIPEIRLNTLDRYDNGLDGLYLTVTGISAESGDSGQVGRGNNPAGLISISRPMGVEAASGKNSISHIGKIYNHFCFYLADRIYKTLNQEGINSVYVWMVSRIGVPIDKPTIIYIKHDGPRTRRLEIAISNLVTSEMHGLGDFCEKLAKGEIGLA